MPEMSEENYYQLLGVKAAASTDDIRNAYKDKALKHHPDRGGDPAFFSKLQRAYDTLSDTQRRAMYDRTRNIADGGVEKNFADKFSDGTFEDETSRKRGGMNIKAQMDEVIKDEERMKETNRTAVTQTGYEMSHEAGFQAWLRNNQSQTGFFTAEDLLRSSRTGGPGGIGSTIQVTDFASIKLPTLKTVCVEYEKHGNPEQVLAVNKVHALPPKLAHGEVLVYMLAASCNEEDLLRVQTPLSMLNEFPPFDRAHNKWEEIQLPAIAGVEGVGIVLSTAKNVPHLEKYSLEVKDWVIMLPDSRLAPVGTWTQMMVCDSARLLKVPADLLPLQHFALSRSLCTGFRLLEDFGSLRPGDTVIQNAADLPVGQAVIQLCRLLKIKTINLIADDENFDRTKELLTKLGATNVLRDNRQLNEFLNAINWEQPRLALDAIGGENGKRMALALRPGCPLVLYSLQSGAVPALSPSVVMYQQISVHGFSLSQWVSDNGETAYLEMLESLSDLVKADRLNIFARTLSVDELDLDSLRSSLKSFRAPEEGQLREKTVFILGSEAGANEMYFDLTAKIKAIEEHGSEEAALQASTAFAQPATAAPPVAAAAPKATIRQKVAADKFTDVSELLKDLKLEQYLERFEEEEMTSIELLTDIAARDVQELVDALKELGIKKMGHRQAIVRAITGG